MIEELQLVIKRNEGFEYRVEAILNAPFVIWENTFMMQARKTTIFNSSGLSLFENSEKDITGQNEASSYGGT